MNTAQFLKENPICIFCGGNTAATTRDHIPPRQLFRDRQWPEGYEFPACEPCNASTRNHEQFVSVLTRFYPDSATPSEQSEFKKSLAGAWNNIGQPMETLRPSARNVRLKLKELGIEKDPNLGTWEYPFLSVASSEVRTSLRLFAQKLFCALHYKHTSKIIPNNAAIAWRWFSNIQAARKEIPEGIFRITPGRPVIKRNGKSLQNQFDYGFGVSDTGEIGAYFATFRFTFAMYGFVSFDSQKIPESIHEQDTVSPLIPNRTPDRSPPSSRP